MALAGTTPAGQVRRALARRWRGLELLLYNYYYLMLWAVLKNGFVPKSEEIINNLAALKWLCLGLFQSYLVDSTQ